MQIPHEFLILSKLLYPLPHDDGMVRGCDYGMRMSMITIDWLIVTSQQVFNGIQPNVRFCSVEVRTATLYAYMAQLNGPRRPRDHEEVLSTYCHVL